MSHNGSNNNNSNGNAKASPDVSGIVPPASRWQHFHRESIQDREERYAELFRKMDVNKDGTICIADLTEALHNLGLRNHPQAAKVRTKYIYS